MCIVHRRLPTTYKGKNSGHLVVTYEAAKHQTPSTNALIKNAVGLTEELFPKPKRQEAVQKVKKHEIKPIATKPSAGPVNSGRSFKMGCGMGGRKLIRGSSANFYN